MGRKKTDLPPGAINCAGTPYPDALRKCDFCMTNICVARNNVA
jgi:hypothetical protein